MNSEVASANGLERRRSRNLSIDSCSSTSSSSLAGKGYVKIRALLNESSAINGRTIATQTAFGHNYIDLEPTNSYQDATTTIPEPSQKLNRSVEVEPSTALRYKIDDVRAETKLALDALETRLARLEGHPTYCSSCSKRLSEQRGVQDDSISEASAKSSDAPVVVDEYFEAAGEAFVADERLTELDASYDEDIANLKANAYNIDELRLTERVLQDEYQARRHELFNALTLANHKANIRREACISQRIDPERFRYRRLSTYKRGSFGEGVDKQSVAGLELAFDTVSDSTQRNESVKEWLGSTGDKNATSYPL